MKLEKKKSMILTIVALTTFVALVVGATYAYFQATGGVGSNSKVNVETATTDLITFNFSKGIAIYADQSNFGKGAGNQSDSTKGTATLTASNSTNIESTSDRYNIYFIVDSNDFIYTTSDNKTELLLQVTDPNGNEVTAIDGLLYKDNGFDITTRTGGFLLVPDYDISANRGETTTQDWKITVTLINLDTNQSENMGKTFSGKLYMTKDQMSSYELSQIKNMSVITTYNSIDTTLEVTNGSAEITKYYFANEKISSDTTSMLSTNKLAVSDVTFVEITNPNYKFTNLDSNSTYKIYSYAVDKNGIKTNMYETEVTTDSYVIPTIDSVAHTSTLNSITVNVTASKGSNDVVKYYYSNDNGETYIESTESSYTFSNLADTAEYKIKIKVEDTDGILSTIYSENIKTETYILPSINKADVTTKYDQLVINVTTTGGTNEVAKYYYSINNSSYVEDGASHTFTVLTEQTTYTIKVKVIDTNGRESVVYETSAKTDAYKLPIVTIASTSSTSNSITINLEGKDGDGNITEYYYSKDNGSNYVSSTSSSYTFTELTSDATFNIKVYAKDANGRSSSEVGDTIQTLPIYTWERYVTVSTTNYYWQKCTIRDKTETMKYTTYSYYQITNKYYAASFYDSMASNVYYHSKTYWDGLTAKTIDKDSCNKNTLALKSVLNSGVYIDGTFYYTVCSIENASLTGSSCYAQGTCYQPTSIDTTYSYYTSPVVEVTSESSDAYPQDGYSDGYYYIYLREEAAYSQGDYIEEVTSENENEYPTNDQQDGYWYVKK